MAGEIAAPSFTAGVENTDSNSATTGTSGSITNSSNDVLNTIHNIVTSLQSQTSQTAGSTTQNQNQSSTGNQSTTGTSTSATTGSTVNTGTSTTSSDQQSIDLTKTIAAQGLQNSTDTTKTNDLVSGIIKQAAIAFAPTRVASNGSGSYNNTSIQMLSDNAAALATGTAAGAVLNYQTAQQQIAQTAAQGLLGATKTTQDTSGSQTQQGTTTGSTSDTSSANNTNTNTAGTNNSNTGTATAGSTTTDATVNTLTNLLSTVFSNNSSQTSGSSTSEKAGLALSIVCTELTLQGKMSRKVWMRGMQEFAKYPEYGKQGYYIWARPCVRELQDHPYSWKSKMVTKLFLARATGSKFARSFIALLSFTLGLYWLAFLKVAKEEGEFNYD